MRMSSEDKSAHTTVDEQQRSSEFFAHGESQSPKENPLSKEYFRSEEIKTESEKGKTSPKRQNISHNLTLLSSTGMGLSMVAATVAVSVAVILPTAKPTSSSILSSGISEYEESIVSSSSDMTSNSEKSSNSDASSNEDEAPLPTQPSPVFTMTGQEIGMDFFQGELLSENAEGRSWNVILKNVGGQIIEQTSIDTDGNLMFENLRYGSKYTITVEDDSGEEWFTHSFTTQSFVSFVSLADGTGMQLVLHSSIPMESDYRFELYDAEGKRFSDNVYMREIYGETSGDSSDSADIVGFEHCLSYEGLYTGVYVLQLITYVEDGEVVYERNLYLGDLTPLTYTVSVEQTAGEIVLQYVSGDLGPYESFEVELYQGGEWYDYASATVNGDGSITISLSSDWESGTYTLYLVGISSRYAYNQIFKCTIVI